MYNLLIVDDEEIAVRGIAEGIDWSKTDIAHIFMAYDADEARQILQTETIEIMITDIDMPTESGIELIRWVKTHCAEMQTIFLTAHADFQYAQQAIQLNCLDYLLKPVDHGVLRDCVERAIQTIQERERERSFQETYSYYYDQWHRQLPQMVDRFWQDVYDSRIPMTAEHMEPQMRLYGIELDFSQPILPVMIRIEEWHRSFNARDKEILTFALQNAASELILETSAGHVLQEQHGMIYALFYNPDTNMRDVLWNRADEYLKKCRSFLHVTVSCYIGYEVPIPEIRSCMQQLMKLECSTYGQTGQVYSLDTPYSCKKCTAAAPNFQEWSVLVLKGEKRELITRVEGLFHELQSVQPDHTYMNNYYFGVVHMVLQLLQKRSLPLQSLYSEEEWKQGETMLKSLKQMMEWTLLFLGRAADYFGNQAKETSCAVITRVQQFIEAHLQDEITRESIAEHVFLNPAYLSRLFRKETGMSLTEYLVNIRIGRAKQELELTNEKISEVSLSIGYTNFSHFSKVFKDCTGMTPQEYRKKYQRIG